jgi:hypothetical protein
MVDRVVEEITLLLRREQTNMKKQSEEAVHKRSHKRDLKKIRNVNFLKENSEISYFYEMFGVLEPFASRTQQELIHFTRGEFVNGKFIAVTDSIAMRAAIKSLEVKLRGLQGGAPERGAPEEGPPDPSLSTHAFPASLKKNKEELKSEIHRIAVDLEFGLTEAYAVKIGRDEAIYLAQQLIHLKDQIAKLESDQKKLEAGKKAKPTSDESSKTKAKKKKRKGRARNKHVKRGAPHATSTTTSSIKTKEDADKDGDKDGEKEESADESDADGFHSGNKLNLEGEADGVTEGVDAKTSHGSGAATSHTAASASSALSAAPKQEIKLLTMETHLEKLREYYNTLLEDSSNNLSLFKRIRSFITNDLGGWIDESSGGAHFRINVPHWKKSPLRIIPGRSFKPKKDVPPLWKSLMLNPVAHALDLEPLYRVSGEHIPG